MFKRIILFGDNIGIPQLLEVLPPQIVNGIVISSLRPQYFDKLKIFAKNLNIPLLIQPKYGTCEYDSYINQFREMKFDLLLCNCYSMIIRKEILEAVNYNAINIHWALLPLNRGANPTQWAMIKGENKTGITMHYMDENIDSGDIIAQTEEVILETDTWLTVNERLNKKSAEFLNMYIPDIILGKNGRSKQDEKRASINKRLTPDYPKIDFEKMTDREIFNLIRAQVYPLKGAYIEKNGKRIYFDHYMDINEVSRLRDRYGK